MRHPPATTSSKARRTYALITPARDEAENLTRLAESIVDQTISPTAWLIVDNGSTDGTVELARRLASEHLFIDVLEIPGAPSATRGAPSVRAFTAGLAVLEGDPDVVVNLDADVSMPIDYFERLLAVFGGDDRLGIASGLCLERSRGEWQETPVTGGHVRGATRAYRRECLQEVLPLEERVGWDGIDVYKARANGWRTATIRSISFKHHRQLGEREGSRRRAWFEQGRAAHYMGYRPLYLLLRTALRMLREPAAGAMLQGYAISMFSGEPRIADPHVQAAVKRDQTLANVPRRVVEALFHLT
jgi:biofilm PGA synthesis N-glycosyltransferase PgaC